MNAYPIHTSRVIAVVSLVLLAGYATANDRTSLEWLQAMEDAMRITPYEGNLSYWDGQDMTTLHFLHEVENGTQNVTVDPLDGDEEESTRISKKLRQSSITALISDVYDLGKPLDDRIADRPAVCISITPKQPDRYSMNICICKQSNILLKKEVCDEHHNKLTILKFSEINIKETDFLDIASNTDLEQTESEDEKKYDLDLEWQVDWVPKGFAITSAADHLETQESSNASYSDGLFSFSVFVSESDSVNDGSIESQHGPTVIVSRMTSDKGGRAQMITVVGDLPKETIWKINRGIKFEP